jgi:hypothetical protein
MTINADKARMLKKTVVTSFKVRFLNASGEAKGDQDMSDVIYILHVVVRKLYLPEFQCVKINYLYVTLTASVV